MLVKRGDEEILIDAFCLNATQSLQSTASLARVDNLVAVPIGACDLICSNF
jgi:hypothetical protein